MECQCIDGFITALAAGSVGLDLIGALLEALALEHGSLNVGGTPEFAAMKAAADRFNRIAAELTNRTIIRPHHRRRGNGDSDILVGSNHANMKDDLLSWKLTP